MDLQPRNGTNIVTDFNERTQFVGDSADVAQFVSCRTIASVRGCSRSRCPNGTPIDPPLIAIDDNETRTLVYRAGRWARDVAIATRGLTFIGIDGATGIRSFAW